MTSMFLNSLSMHDVKIRMRQWLRPLPLSSFKRGCALIFVHIVEKQTPPNMVHCSYILLKKSHYGDIMYDFKTD